ncbi:MAG: YihA family ribosome biogenesis GTP-binding protein [Rhodospirillaceae bacterium]|nr:YihA family ribosome biogenesis GTP-binding protein [Rhodospirillaceae bacterium]|tara:strand:- start:5316 stop:5978 length:663 start_codon:yes stop_codon:yes gene_type:complete
MAQDSDENPDHEKIEFGRKFFAGSCQFFAGATSLENLPSPDLPEIAFAGRSNVGKSSLINALTGQTSLARTSRTPGRTQQLNFFNLADRMTLVDMPGYGYARASKSRIRDWTALMHDYLKGRATLHRLCLLIDGRHGLKESDETLMNELDDAAVVYQIVLTKSDKVSKAALVTFSETFDALRKKHPAAHPDIIATSARKGVGIAELRASLAVLAAPHQFR